MGPIITQASSSNSFMAQMLVIYLLQFCKQLMRLVGGHAARCVCVSGNKFGVSFAVTQHIAGKNRIPLLHSVLKKDRKTPPSWSEVGQSVGSSMNSSEVTFLLSWRTEVTISHGTKQQRLTLRALVDTPGCLLASHVFQVAPPCQRSVWPLPEMESSDAETLWSQLTSRVTGSWHIDELLRSVSLTLFHFGSWLQIMRSWAGLRASCVLWGRVRLSPNTVLTSGLQLNKWEKKKKKTGRKGSWSVKERLVFDFNWGIRGQRSSDEPGKNRVVNKTRKPLSTNERQG